VENGEIKYPVKECMIGGNLFEFLMNISAMSKVVRRRGPLITPQIVIENASIVGRT